MLSSSLNVDVGRLGNKVVAALSTLQKAAFIRGFNFLTRKAEARREGYELTIEASDGQEVKLRLRDLMIKLRETHESVVSKLRRAIARAVSASKSLVINRSTGSRKLRTYLNRGVDETSHFIRLDPARTYGAYAG